MIAHLGLELDVRVEPDPTHGRIDLVARLAPWLALLTYEQAGEGVRLLIQPPRELDQALTTFGPGCRRPFREGANRGLHRLVELRAVGHVGLRERLSGRWIDHRDRAGPFDELAVDKHPVSGHC